MTWVEGLPADEKDGVMPNISPIDLIVSSLGLLIIILVIVTRSRRSERSGVNWPQKSLPPQVTPATLSERLAQLQEARAAGLVTEEEYATRRAKIIDAS